MVRIYKYLVVSALIALLCSCEADYKPDDLFDRKTLVTRMLLESQP